MALLSGVFSSTVIELLSVAFTIITLKMYKLHKENPVQKYWQYFSLYSNKLTFRNDFIYFFIFQSDAYRCKYLFQTYFEFI